MHIKKLIKSIKSITLLTATIAIATHAQEQGQDQGQNEFSIDALLATRIPVMIINTENGTEINSKVEYTKIESFELIDPENSSNYISRDKSQAARPDAGRYADEIRGRGNATWGGMWGIDYPKKPYRLRFTEQIKVLGLPKARNWVLLAEYRDPSFMFNALAFEVAKNVLRMPYTNNYIHVHLIVNNEQGVIRIYGAQAGAREQDQHRSRQGLVCEHRRLF